MSSVGVLASSITHEFNNILTTVINYAKLGLRHDDAAMKEKAFSKILAAGQRAAKITTGMLSYSRNGGNRKEPINLAEFTAIYVDLDDLITIHQVVGFVGLARPRRLLPEE